MRIFLLSLAAVCFLCRTLSAQTTLSGDHVITGDLEVGSSGARGNLGVMGETGNAAAPTLKITGDGGVVFLGSPGTGQIPATGAGSRFMWYPKKFALRAGKIAGSWMWDDANIGDGSIALGLDTVASGSNSVSLGCGVASGNQSFVIGGGVASGLYSRVVGADSEASGEGSIAIGYFTLASGYSSTAMGDTTTASGNFSTAMGYQTISSGSRSTAMGFRTIAQAYGQLVIGRYNIPQGTTISDVATDCAFIIGNGTGTSARSNAFAVRKNGDVEITGKVVMPRQGDILMGQFGNPE